MDTISIEQTLQQFLNNPESLDMNWMTQLFIILLIGSVIAYVYTALTLSNISKKLNNPKPWLAWIPVANIVLTWQISSVAQWTLICYFAFIAAFILSISTSSLASMILIPITTTGILVINVYWWWMICKKLGKPGWLSLLQIPIPIIPTYLIWWIVLGILAWGKTDTKNS